MTQSAGFSVTHREAGRSQKEPALTEKEEGQCFIFLFLFLWSIMHLESLDPMLKKPITFHSIFSAPSLRAKEIGETLSTW